MNTDELAELLLAAIYCETENIGHPYVFFSLKEVAATLGAGDMTNLFEAVQSLESKGLVLLSQSSPDDVGIMITNDGSLVAEQGGETGIIKEYRDYREKVGATQPSPDHTPQETIPAPGGSPGIPQEAAFQGVIMEIMHAFINDGALDAETRDYLLKDVDALHTQLSKQTRNMKLIEMLLKNLGSQTSIKHLIEKLSLLI
ncbi:MAG TPA: hypothetical protein PLX02_07295 [Syntrophorhabdaceae bacterium]|nr:hypothetical protein [Syntrophorhabdaceae bacterium]HQM81411.1 hypothetical protein [Syntrophorhabdaceae bacterium]